MTEGTSQGLFIVVAIVIFGIFVGLSYNLFGKTLQPALVNLFETALNMDVEGGEGPITPPVIPETPPVDLEEVVVFGDARVEAAVRRTLSLPTPDEPITIGKMHSEDFKELKFNGGNEGIKNLNGLEHAINLTSISGTGNKLSDISAISKLYKLESIMFSTNEITDLKPLENLVNLKNLGLTFNNIEDISPLSKLTNLTTLSLTMNQITNLEPLSKMTNLKEIYLSKNNITDLTPLSNLKKLQMLDVAQNSITDYSPVSFVPFILK